MILPGSDRHIAELHFLTFALQADITVFLLVPSGVLINAVDVDVDLSVFHIDVGLVPFAGRAFRALAPFFEHRNRGAQGLRTVDRSSVQGEQIPGITRLELALDERGPDAVALLDPLEQTAVRRP